MSIADLIFIVVGAAFALGGANRAGYAYARNDALDRCAASLLCGLGCAMVVYVVLSA